MNTQLDRAIRHAEAIFLDNTERLITFAERRGRRQVRSVAKDTIRVWLMNIKHNPNGQHRRKHNYALAYSNRQQITYNPLVTREQPYDDMLDMVLHEMGHLFTYWFFGTNGHDHDWRSVGTIVGYAQVGATSIHKRRRYHAFAAQAANVDVPDTRLGKVGSVSERDRSTIDSPVARVWDMCEAWGYDHTRKFVIERCVSVGINRNTASTQYARWKRERKGF